MIKVALLSANLGGFDVNIENIKQNLPEGVEMTFHRWNDENFPPIAGLTPRMQYRIPKLHGWEMFPGYDFYLWMDGSVHIINPYTISWFLEIMENKDFAIFKHPHRHTIDEEVRYIEWKLSERNMYLSRRYQNGLHREQLELIKKDLSYKDDVLYASTVFMYRNTPKVQEMMKDWWYYQSRFWTCDQVQLPYVLFKHDISVYRIDKNVFDNEYITTGERHAS